MIVIYMGSTRNLSKIATCKKIVLGTTFGRGIYTDDT